MPLSEDEIKLRVEAVQAAKRRRVEGGEPKATLTKEDVERAVETWKPETQPVIATPTVGTNGKSAPPGCKTCGRPKTPRARGYWCKPCWEADRAGIVTAPRVTLPEPTATPTTTAGPIPLLAEIDAMRNAVVALEPLDAESRARVVRWLSDRIGA